MATVGQPDVTTTTVDSLDTQAIKQVADAAGRMRATARWTVGAFGAVATAIAGTVTIKGLEDLQDGRFALGALGLLLAIAGAGVVINAAAGVLAPTNIPLEKASGESLTPEMLLGEPNPGAFAAKLQEVEGKLIEAIGKPMSTAHLETVIAHARDKAGIYGERAERIRLIAHFNKLQDTWHAARGWIAAGVLMVVLGVVGYEYAASEQKTQPIHQPDVSAAPELSVDFKAGAVPSAITAGCGTDRRAFSLPDRGKDALLLLVVGKGADCPGVFVRVATSQVTTKEVAIAGAKAAVKKVKPATP